MKTLRFALALALLCGLSLAQSGSGSWTGLLTNNVVTVNIPAPPPGYTQIVFQATTTFRQSAALTNNSPSPLSGTTLFGNTVVWALDGTVYESCATRAHVDLWCDSWSTAAGDVPLSVLGSAYLGHLSGAPLSFTIANSARSEHRYPWPINGVLITQSISRCDVAFSWTLLP